MRLKLPFLDQIHDAGDASESERPVGHGRNRSVKFQPRIGLHFHRVTNVDWRYERKTLQQNHQRCGERAHQREAIQRAHQHVHQRHRPRQKNENLKQVRQRTATQSMTADRQERRLKNESQADRKKIESHRTKYSTTQLNNRVHDCCEKTNCRNDEKIAIHRESLF